MKAATGHASRQ